MSIAGGYYRAIESAHAVGCDCVQVFTKNNNQWKAKSILPDEAQQFSNALTRLGIRDPLSHTSYLINLASPDAGLLRQSIDAMVVELQRAAQLGVPNVVLHPGSFTSSSEAQGLQAVARSLDEVFRQTSDLPTACLLENTAGQGTNLGWRFEHLAEIIAECKYPDRLGVCIDTCHTFAAGYSLAPEPEYVKTLHALDRMVGLSRVKAFHLNDSKMPFGSRRDRHEHIGRGAMTLEPFRLLLNDSRFAKVPMYLETDKGTEGGEELDAINLRTLRFLVGAAAGVALASLAKSSEPGRRPARGKRLRTGVQAKPKLRRGGASSRSRAAKSPRKSKGPPKLGRR